MLRILEILSEQHKVLLLNNRLGSFKDHQVFIYFRKNCLALCLNCKGNKLEARTGVSSVLRSSERPQFQFTINIKYCLSIWNTGTVNELVSKTQ